MRFHPDGAGDAGHDLVPVRAGHGVGALCGLFAASSAVPATGADAGGNFKGVAFAAAVHVLAVSGLPASGNRAATAGGAGADAAAGVGSGARAVAGSIHMLLRLVHGHWPPVTPPHTPAGVFQRDICEQYDRWMTDVRGLSPVTRSDRCAEARRFLSWLAERGSPQALPKTTANDIDTYMMLRANSLRRSTLTGRATDLRSFLRYLHDTGRLVLEPSTSVIIPRFYAFQGIPSALRAEEIKAVLGVTRKDRSRKGFRDFAILMLLSGYGLRAGEVTGLRLEDVEWRSGTLRIRHSKTSAYSELPLLPAVGNAILDYLQKGRPNTQAREIFIRTCAPYRAFQNGSSLHGLISKRLKAAGIEPQGRRGPHAFRHARAISMLQAAVPINKIGDVLGHRSANSTNTYLKLASADLRAVALEIPVEVSA